MDINRKNDNVCVECIPWQSHAGCRPQELVEDVHLGGVAIDAAKQHIYWTAAWPQELTELGQGCWSWCWLPRS